MKQLFIVDKRKSEVREVPDITPGKGQLLVKVRYNGVCMSDWYPWAEASEVNLGHEPVGIVEGLGEGVTKFRVGDRVSGLADSASLAEYCLMREEHTVLVPENLSDVDAIAEPLSCLVSAASKLTIEKIGDTVAVVGAGYMGLGMVSLFKHQGAGNIIVVDPREQARENAIRFGATEVYAPDQLPSKYLVTDMDDKIWIDGIKIVSEFSGTESGLRLAGDIVGVHGTLGIGGWHQGGDRTIDIRRWGWKAFTAINTHERRQLFQTECCERSLDMLSRDLWDFKGVTNHVYGLDEFDRANEEMATKPTNIIKSAIKCSDW